MVSIRTEREVKEENARLRAALTEIETMPFTMVNDSESLRHTIRAIQLAASKALTKRPA